MVGTRGLMRLLIPAVVMLLVFLWIPTLEAGKRRVHIPDDLSDVVDNEEDEAWKEWGKPKPRLRPEYDPPPDFKDGMDVGEYQKELIKRQFGPSMGFAKLRIDVPRELDEAPRIAGKWTELLKTGSIDSNLVAVDKNTIMFTIPNGQDALEVKDFVLSQPEAYEFKLGQNTFRRPGDPELEVVIERMRMGKAKKKHERKEEL
ncbi:hypothetical protein R1flu_010741 [Riccia fluitans]|uniref:Mesoderm development candidate 2 n=1 Tax=Riccia fluitans TaxID=41844 RepID=A0ABD1Z5U5_9MARC